MKRLLREPLVHFLAIGIGLFVLFDLVAPEDSNLDSKTIVVDRDALLTFVQFRSKAFNPEWRQQGSIAWVTRNWSD